MQTITERRHQDYERFEENRRFEERTDIAERLGFPIDLTIHYALKDGALYASSDTVDRPFHNQTLQAKLAGESQYAGDQAFQRTRLELEHDEALLADQLGRGELDGNMLIKFSKVPDAVAEGRTSINGYRRDILRSFVRIYHKTDTGVECRLFTIDHNHKVGVERVGKLLDIDTTRSSEEVLRDHTVWDVPGDPADFTAQLTEKVIGVYDHAILESTGRVAYAGSQYVNKQEALSAVFAQEHLFSAHMDTISQIAKLGLGEDAQEMERKKIAAAIKLATEGHQVNSSGDSAVAAEVASGDYGRDCATSNGMNQAATMDQKNEWKSGTCRVCFAEGMVGSCQVCRRCEEADNHGVDLLELQKQNLRRRALQKTMAEKSVSNDVTKPQNPNKTKLIRARYGDNAKIRRRVQVGGAVEEVYDARTDTVIDTL